MRQDVPDGARIDGKTIGNHLKNLSQSERKKLVGFAYVILEEKALLGFPSAPTPEELAHEAILLLIDGTRKCERDLFFDAIRDNIMQCILNQIKSLAGNASGRVKRRQERRWLRVDDNEDDTPPAPRTIAEGLLTEVYMALPGGPAKDPTYQGVESMSLEAAVGEVMSPEDDCLSTQQKEITEMIIREDLTGTVIAERLGISGATVTRAKQAFVQCVHARRRQ